MKFIIVPVKDLSKAKERLSSVLSQEDRTALAYAMLEDVLIAVQASKLADRRFIVTMDRRAIEIALSYGIEVIEETEQKGESHSVDYASRICMDKGAVSVLVIPGDAPLITSEDIDFVLEKEKEAPSVILVPARDDFGTNAILRKPPDAIPSRFGDDSFRKHTDEAMERGIHIDTFRNSRIALDIDHPDDLTELLSQKADTKTFDILSGLNFIDKKAG